MAEHHARHSFADAAPEVLIARLVCETKRIRLGSGGVLLNHYSPLKIAETFRMLEALAPGRIDLGLGRATGSDERTEVALRGWVQIEERYEERILELLAFLSGGFASDHPFASVLASPEVETEPEPWLLGSSGFSANLAAVCGLPFAYAHFIAGDAESVVRAYRERYTPSARWPEPRVILTAGAFCSDDPAEREAYWRVLGLWRARVRLGPRPMMPSRDEARAHVASANEQHFIDQTRTLATCGGSGEIRAQLTALAQRHLADELMIITVAPDYASRLASYECLAKAFELR